VSILAFTLDCLFFLANFRNKILSGRFSFYMSLIFLSYIIGYFFILCDSLQSYEKFLYLQKENEINFYLS